MFQQIIKKEPTINGRLFSEFGGATLQKYTVSASELNNYTFFGQNRTSFEQLKTTFGPRTVRLDVKFAAPDLRTCTLQKSIFDGALFGKNELWLPDGFFYSVYTDSIGEAAIEADTADGVMIGASYTFKGFRHDAMRTHTIPAGGARIKCLSTMPATDCILSVTVPVTLGKYQLGGAVFGNVKAGEKLTFDGINKRILRNGVDNALNVSWLNFPQLAPGFNQIAATYPTTVQYYPTYI